MQDAYAVDNMASQRTLRPKRKGNGESFNLGKIFLPINRDLQEQHFLTGLKLKDLYPRKVSKMR